MPATYTATPAGTPTAAVAFSQPVDGDNLTAASINTGIAALANVVKGLVDHAMWDVGAGGVADVASTRDIAAFYRFTSRVAMQWTGTGAALSVTTTSGLNPAVLASGAVGAVRGDVTDGAGRGVHGVKDVASTGAFAATDGAVLGESTVAAGYALAVVGRAASGVASNAYGVFGRASSPGAGVYGIADPSDTALNGVAHGVIGESYGNSLVAPSAGVRGIGQSVAGAYGNFGGWFSAVNSTGVYSTGKLGVHGESGNANGIGLYGLATGSLGVGIIAQGFYGLMAQSLDPAGYAIWALKNTGAAAGEPAMLVSGSILFETAASNFAVNSTTAKNRLTPRNIPRSWIVIDCNGTANPAVLGSSYGAITQVTGAGQGVITVNLPIPMASSANYFVSVSSTGLLGIQWAVTILSATQFTLSPYNFSGVSQTAAAVSGAKVNVLVFGDQA